MKRNLLFYIGFAQTAHRQAGMRYHTSYRKYLAALYRLPSSCIQFLARHFAWIAVLSSVWGEMHLDRDKTSETKWTDGKGIQIDFSLHYIFLISGAKIPKRRFSSIISSSYHLFFHHLVLISPPLLFISHITRWIHELLMTTAEIDRSVYFMQPTHISSMLRPKKASFGKNGAP